MTHGKAKNRLSLKIIAFITAIVFILYSIFWFFVANELGNIAEKLNYESGNWEVSYEKAKVSGYPFKFKLKIENANITYHNKLSKFKIVTLLNNLEATTDARFTYIDFTLPKDILVDTYFNQKYKKWQFITKHEPHLKISEAGLINTFKIAELIYDPTKFDQQEYYIEGFEYLYKDLNCIDIVANKTLITSTADTKLKLKNIPQGYSLSLKSDSNINFTDSEYVGHNFKTIDYKADIFLKTKKGNGIYSAVSLIDLNLLQLALDKHSIGISGKVDYENNNDVTNLDLKIQEWDSFLKSLADDQIISLDKKHILEKMMQDITGKEYNDNVETEIYTTKEGSIRIGKAESSSINTYLKQLMISK
jgi:hypothetical protein